MRSVEVSALVLLLLLCCQVSWTRQKECDLEDESTVREMMDQVDPGKIRDKLRFLASQPHLAGTARDDQLVSHIQELFQDAGLENVQAVPYEVMLSYPDYQQPNQVHIVDENGTILTNSTFKEHIFDKSEDSPDFVPAYHSYSPAGDVTADVVFANYGRQEDFEELRRLGINVTGTICIVKMGKIYRGSKVSAAAQNGAVGIILYPDPKDYAADGTEDQNVYPNKWWLPGSAIQRGSVSSGWGDPLTPGWPSLEGVFRLEKSEANLPTIPAQPIGYDDAKEILMLMGGDLVPSEWNGSLPDLEYRLGPGFQSPNETLKLRLVVNNHLLDNVTIFNVVGMIKGAVEPDRYVIFGNHRDSWGFGAADAVSGTTGLLETVRIYGLMKKKG